MTFSAAYIPGSTGKPGSWRPTTGRTSPPLGPARIPRTSARPRTDTAGRQSPRSRSPPRPRPPSWTGAHRTRYATREHGTFYVTYFPFQTETQVRRRGVLFAARRWDTLRESLDTGGGRGEERGEEGRPVPRVRATSRRRQMARADGFDWTRRSGAQRAFRVLRRTLQKCARVYSFRVCKFRFFSRKFPLRMYNAMPA